MNNIKFSFGKNKYDSRPVGYQACWSNFVDFIDGHRARVKGLNYIAAAFGGDGFRNKLNALPRSWLCMDNDSECSTVDFLKIEKWLKHMGVNACLYETASSKLNAHRFRIIIELNCEVVEGQAKFIGQHFESKSPIKNGWDGSVYRASQPVFLPPRDAVLVEFCGTPFDVSQLISTLPRLPRLIRHGDIKRRYTNSPNVFKFFSENDLVIAVGAHGIHKVICPWQHMHSDGDQSGTAIYEPSEENHMLGGFHCFHAHCAGKSIRDVFRLMSGDNT